MIARTHRASEGTTPPAPRAQATARHPPDVFVMDAGVVSLQRFLIRHLISAGEDREAASLALKAIDALDRSKLVPLWLANQRT